MKIIAVNYKYANYISCNMQTILENNYFSIFLLLHFFKDYLFRKFEGEEKGIFEKLLYFIFEKFPLNIRITAQLLSFNYKFNGL